MGVATADLAFAVVAAAAGGAAGAALASHEAEIKVVAALVLAAIAVTASRACATGRDGAVAGAGRRGGSHYRASWRSPARTR